MDEKEIKDLKSKEEKEREALLDGLKSNDPATDRYKQILDAYLKLEEVDRKRKKDKAERIDRNINSAIGHIIAIGGVVLPVVAYCGICMTGFEIEKEGVIGSNLLETCIKDFTKVFKIKGKA